jgi:putative chitinase
MITKAQLLAVMPTATERADAWMDPLNSAMDGYGISTPQRVAAFIATVAEESQELSRVRESLSYSSAMRLRFVFPTHFASDEEAQPFVGDPQATANRVYGGRMGNGAEASGDGWRFRGRGLVQLTGRELYGQYGRYRQLPLLDHPEMLELPEYAADSAGWFWAELKGLNAVADLGDFKRVTQLVNGGFEGWAQRRAYYLRAAGVL